MSAYHLSPLRNKGWLRAGFIAAILMLPLAAMEHALGYFSEGLKGFLQAVEFVIGGMAFALIVGTSAGWVLRGFALRTRDDDEDRDKERPAASRPGPATPAVGEARGRHGPAAGSRH